MHEKTAADELKDVTVEPLGPFSFMQWKKGYRVTGDTVELVDFVLPLDKKDTVVDLGTGTGAIPLLLAWKSPVEKIVGVEVDKETAGLAERNVTRNGLASRVALIEKDWRGLDGVYPEGAFSVVVCNPPYTKKGAGRKSPMRQRALARSEVMGTLEELLSVSSHLAGPKGRIFLMYPVIRLKEVRVGLKGAGLTEQRVSFIDNGAGRDAKVFLMEAGRAGGAGGAVY